MTPFVILGMPRAQTAWLARFLTYGDRNCVHEPSRTWLGLPDLYAALDAGQGISDSTLTLRWREIVGYRPDTAVVVVHRPKHEVLGSFRRAGIWHDRLPDALDVLDRAIDDLTEVVPSALHVPVEALSKHEVCDRVFHHCLGRAMPFEHWHKWVHQKVVADGALHIRDAAENPAFGVLFPELLEAA